MTEHRRWFPVAFLLVLLAASTQAGEDPSAFRSAKPVWLTGRETEMNLAVGFRAEIPRASDPGVVLKVACSTVYRAWLNGAFLAYGPARGPHGYYRIDELPLQGLLHEEQNVLAIEVAGYNVNSYDTLDQPAFLQAEVVAGGNRVLASTAGAGLLFRARVVPDRVQKVQRYSFQRPFIEVYQLSCRFRSVAHRTRRRNSRGTVGRVWQAASSTTRLAAEIRSATAPAKRRAGHHRAR